MNTIQDKAIPYLHENARAEFFGNAAVFEISPSDIGKYAFNLLKNKNCTLKLITATDERRSQQCFKIWYVFGAPQDNIFIVPYIKLKNTFEFPSITPSIHQAWNHEKKLWALFGLKPINHPDPRTIILHENWPADAYPLRKDFNWDYRPDDAHGSYHFQRIKGESIYEIPVGPVHAGIIEPGHFRFSVAGEEIMLLEPRLGFTHKGTEKLFERLSLHDTIRLSEKISGDSSFTHSLAFCMTLEQLGDIAVPARASYLRLIYGELERVANHFGDIGAIMLDTGFNFGGSHGARLREMIMQINERITGSRFLRGVNNCGGVTKDIRPSEAEALWQELGIIARDFSGIIEAAGNSASLLNRLKSTGILSRDVAKDHGVVGIAARAVEIPMDARIDFPYAAYKEMGFISAETEAGGDVYARFGVRVKEALSSISLIRKSLRILPQGDICAHNHDAPFRKNAVAVSIVEGWRGDIVYFITTDADGNLSRVAPRDPSFINWPLLEHAAKGNIVPDFPLINKSFNLSYSGNDL